MPEPPTGWRDAGLALVLLMLLVVVSAAGVTMVYQLVKCGGSCA